ncbi:hypothetical protein COO60DRAFT_1699155 [Scenedesmus sp. NREL 46B-D3]|nr:hypothetical protein COO60DRAFT_1699155 [Scenedesmus sp. NREL 46B-D3]
MPPGQLREKIAEFLADFPPELVHIEAVQLSLEDVTQNYLVAVGGRSVYVAFMGTKQARDISTDLAFSHEAIWAEQELAGTASEAPSAHRGFLARSKAVPIQQLLALAQGSGRRLVLCGHSLGGAVAKLVGLQLLREAPEWPPPALRVVCFATPAVGNNALAGLVEAAGWGEYFKTYVLPEDQLMRMLRITQASISSMPAGASDSSSSSSKITEDVPGNSRPGGSTGRATHFHRSSRPASKPGAFKPAAGTGSAPAEAASPHTSSSSSSSTGGLGQLGAAVSSVGGVLLRPSARGTAKETLRRELRAEEATTPPLDASAMDINPAAAAAAAAAADASHVGLHQLPLSRAAAADAQGGVPAEAGQHTTTATAAGDAPASQLASPPPSPAAAAAAAAAAGPSATAGSRASSSSGMPVQNIGLVMQLHRRWMAYQLQQVSVFHPFGQYWFIACGGVCPLGDPSLAPDAPMQPEAAAWQEANPGVFSFHRMIAHRTRCLQLLARISAELATQGLMLPSVAAAAAGSGSGGDRGASIGSTTGGIRIDLPGSGSSSWQPAVQMGGVVPGMRVQAVAARPPLRSPAALLPAVGSSRPLLGLAGQPNLPNSSSQSDWSGSRGSGSGSVSSLFASGDTAVPTTNFDAADQAAAAAGRPAVSTSASVRRAALSFLPSRGSKVPEPTLQLVFRVQGFNLHMCRHIGLVAFGEQYRPALLVSHASGGGALQSLQEFVTPGLISGIDMPGLGSSSSEDASMAAGAAGGLGTRGSSSATDLQGSSSSSSSVWAPLSMLSPALNRLKQAAVAAAKAWEGERPKWRTPADSAEQLTLQVLLPASVVQQLAEAAAAAPRQQQQQSDLVLQLKSDFEVLSVPVQLQPHRVAVVGSSAGAATLLAALLSQSGAMQQHHQRQAAAAAGRATAAAGSGAAAGAVAGGRAAALQRWLPQPQRWIPAARRQQQQQGASYQAPQQSTEQQQQQQQPQPQPVQKLKAAASLAAAAGANVAASRLGTLSRQLLGRRGSVPGLGPEEEPLPKQMRTAAAAAAASSGSSSSMGSCEEGAGYAPAPMLLRTARDSRPGASAAGGNGSGWLASAAAVPTAPAATSLQDSAQQREQGTAAVVSGTSQSTVHGARQANSSITASHVQGSQQQPATAQLQRPASRMLLDRGFAGWGSSWRAGSSTARSTGGSIRSAAGLQGVVYCTLPLKRSLLPVPPSLPRPINSTLQQHTLARVLKRATQQLQQQAKGQGCGAGPGVLDGAGLMQRAARLAAGAAAGPAAVAGKAWTAVFGSSHSKDSDTTASYSSGQATAEWRGRGSDGIGTRGRVRKPAAAARKAAYPQQQLQQHGVRPSVGTAAVSAGSVVHTAGKPPSSPAGAAAGKRLKNRPQQRQPWDVLVLAITWDADLLQLLRHRAALAALAAAAAAAGVQLLPVLLVEGDEVLLSVPAADLRAAGLQHLAAQQQQQQQGVLDIEDAAAQLAAALHLPSVPLLRLPVQGLLSNSRVSSSGTADAGALLGGVGGLEQQQQLLVAVQRLEGQLAGLLQGPIGGAAAGVARQLVERQALAQAVMQAAVAAVSGRLNRQQLAVNLKRFSFPDQAVQAMRQGLTLLPPPTCAMPMACRVFV